MNITGSQCNGMFGFIKHKKLAACLFKCGLKFLFRWFTRRPVFIKPAVIQRANGNIECALCLHRHLNTCLETFKSRQAELQRLTGGKGIDTGNIAIFNKPAEIIFDAVKLFKRGPGGLLGIHGIVMNYKYLERRRHRVMLETT